MRPLPHIALILFLAFFLSSCEKELNLADLPVDQVNHRDYVLDAEGRVKVCRIMENGSLVLHTRFTYSADSIQESRLDARKNTSSLITYYLNERQEVRAQTRYYFDCETQDRCYTETQYAYRNGHLAEKTETTYLLVAMDSLQEQSTEKSSYYYFQGQLVREEKQIGDYTCFRIYTYGDQVSAVNLFNPRADFLKIPGKALRSSETDNSCFESHQECSNQYQYTFGENGRVSSSRFYRQCSDQFSNATTFHSYTTYGYVLE